MSHRPNQMLSHYRLVERIGKGGMGEVYRAEDTRLGREVALKLLPPELARDPERRSRFEREARAVAALKHPNIVTIHSVEEADGVPFITMELVEGEPLTGVLQSDGLPLERFFELAIPLADAVSSAHEKGITHRDLKPANIMLDADGRLKVLDFGLAKLTLPTADDESAATLAVSDSVTGEGRLLGTASYMSPEQAEGKAVDQRSDIFSLGIVLHEMITGEPPFSGDTAIAILSSILRDDPPRVSAVNPALPHHLGRILHRCLEKAPGKRYQTARDVCNELQALRDEINSGEVRLGRESLPTSGAASGSGSGSGPVTGTEASPDGVPSASTEIAPETSAPTTGTGEGKTPGWALAAMVMVAAALVFVGWWTLLDRDASTNGAASHATSDVQVGTEPDTGPPAATGAGAPVPLPADRDMVAVLPFENLGPTDQAYFAAGITEEIIGRLATVVEVGVISRTSATQYDRTGKTMRQIGDDLGVDYVLEGAVRWAPGADGSGRVRITPRLIQVVDDSPVWSETYDREMNDIFAVQSDIAAQVIEQLGVTLLGSAQGVMPTPPTDDVEAYQAYLMSFDPAATTPADWERIMVDALERATTLDPAFAEAWARLSWMHSFFYGQSWDRTESRLGRAKAALDQAEAIDPSNPATLAARGWYLFSGFSDHDRALEYFQAALAAVPDNAEIRATIGQIHRAQGDWETALADYQEAARLDPRNEWMLNALAETYSAMRRFDEAMETWERSIAVAPASDWKYERLAKDVIRSSGDLARARQMMARCPPEAGGFWYLFGHGTLHLLERDGAGARPWFSALPADDPFVAVVRTMLLAQADYHEGGAEQARPRMEEAARQIDALLVHAPGAANLHAWLAETQAFLGNAESAQREGKLAVDLGGKDMATGPKNLMSLAVVYAWTDRTDEALELIERLLATTYVEPLTPHFLRLDPRWDPIRADPRFQALVAEDS